MHTFGGSWSESKPLIFIQRVFEVMNNTHRHTYQFLTKRADRLVELASDLKWPRNVWMGVTAEDKERLYRVDKLRSVPAKVKFLSIEPLLGPLPDINLDGIDWVIVGGESGSGARPMKREWVIEIRDTCVNSTIPSFSVLLFSYHRNTPSEEQ